VRGRLPCGGGACERTRVWHANIPGVAHSHESMSGRGRRIRRGISLIELSVATVVLAVAMTVTVQIVAQAIAEHRAADRRVCAIQEAGNVLERLSIQPWDKLTPESLEKLELARRVERLIPGAEVTISMVDADSGVAKRVTVQVRWTARDARRTAPVRLTTWLYPREDL
jgi:prepilin-type N-terminal cleavage/methylation domain-containing protein